MSAPTRCPKCDSYNIEGIYDGITPSYYFQTVKCFDCGVIWDETYVFESRTEPRFEDEPDALDN